MADPVEGQKFLVDTLITRTVFGKVTTFVEAYNERVGPCVSAFTKIQAALDAE